MTIERELLKEVLEYFDPLGLNSEHCGDLPERIKELLAQPEQESVYQKLSRIEEDNYVEMLPSELWLDGYEAGKRSALLSKQPEQHGTQYLLDQVARLTAENAMLKEKWSAQPETEQEPVAWMYEWVNEIGEHVKSVVYNFYDDANLIPLYTAPPKREPLSDEEICEILLKKEWNGFVELVRIIEKEHGIGGGE